MKKMKQEKQPGWNAQTLVGKFFHSPTPGGGYGQGCVAFNPEPGWYLCLHYSWMDGAPTFECLYRIEEMKSWRFYLTPQMMQDAYEQGLPRREDDTRKSK